MEHMSDSPASIRDTGSGSFKHDEGSDVMLHTDARLIHVRFASLAVVFYFF